jgi:hypothetical protein
VRSQFWLNPKPQRLLMQIMMQPQQCNAIANSEAVPPTADRTFTQFLGDEVDLFACKSLKSFLFKVAGKSNSEFPIFHIW